jgi:hypothetical protein
MFSCFILFWHNVSNDNSVHSLYLNVFLHGKMFFEFSCHAHARALVHWAFDLPKIVMHAIM